MQSSAHTQELSPGSAAVLGTHARGLSFAAGLAIAAAIALVWFSMMGSRALYDPDEGRYAEIALEMLRGGDWITPHLDGLVYLEKPPLQYWLTASAFRYFGETELTSRLSTGMAGYLSLMVIFLVARRLWGTASGVRAFLLMIASTLFVLLGQQSTLDMLLSFWLLLALSSFLLAQSERERRIRRRSWMLVCWTAMALAVLTKGLIGVVLPAATLCLYVVWQRDTRTLSELNCRWGVAVFCAIALPWFILVARANPAFLSFFFVHEHFERYLTPIAHRTEPWWFFVLVLALGILPWLALALKTVVSTLREPTRHGEWHPERLLCVFSLFVFVFFSFSNGKLVPYVLPMIPALALLCASRPVEDGWWLGVGLALTLVESVVLYVGGHLAWLFPEAEAAMYSGRTGLTWSAATLASTALLMLALLLKSRLQAALTVLCVGSFLSSFGLLIAAREAEGFFSSKDIAATLQTAVVGAPVFAVQVYDQTLPFYLKHTVVLVDYRDEFALGLDQDPARGIASLEGFEHRWQGLQEGYAVMRNNTFESMLSVGLPMKEMGRTHGRVIVSRR